MAHIQILGYIPSHTIALILTRRLFQCPRKKEVPLSVKRAAIGCAKHRVSGAAWVAEKCALPKGHCKKEVPLFKRKGEN